MTKEQFAEKYNLPEFMLESNRDFKMLILSNLSDIQAIGGLNEEGRERINSLKRFIIEYYYYKDGTI